MNSEWININDKVPDYYHGVILFDGKTIHYDWHRLSDGDSTYYGSLNTSKCIDADEITHWRELLIPPKEE